MKRFRPTLGAVLLLAAGAPSLAADASPTLAELIQAGNRAAALEQVRAGADVRLAQPDGTTPLQWATYRVDVELVRALIAKGARADTVNNYGMSALAEAAKLGNAELATLLLDAGAKVDAANADGQTPLMLAVRTGSVPTVQVLLKHRANANAKETWRGQTALMWAAGDGRADLVRLLLKAGAKPDVRADVQDWSGSGGAQVTSEPRAQYKPVGGLTALLYAARSGCSECVTALLDARAGIDLPTPEGVTPLMIALDNVNFDVAALLLDRGADPRLADWWGRTALYVTVDVSSLDTRTTAGGGSFASYNGVPTPGQKTTAMDIAKRLLAAGVEVDTQLNMHRPGRGGNSGRFVDPMLTTGATPLLRAASGRDTAMVALLLAHGAQVDLPNVLGITPLMAASGVGMYVAVLAAREPALDGVDLPARAIATIDALLAAGADINARVVDPATRTSRTPRPNPTVGREGQSPLFGAISWGNVDVIRHLLAKGARVDVKDDSGRTPLDAAKTAGGGGRDAKQVAAIVEMLTAAGKRS